jgi:subtilisin family serine protease
MLISFGYGQNIVRSENPIKGKYIVVLNEDARISDLSVNNLSSLKGKEKHLFKKVLNGFSANLSKSEAEELAKDPNVAFVEEDGYVTASSTQINPPDGLDRIDQRNLPLDQTYNYTYTGQGVTVYVIDSGIYFAHNDFGGRASLGTDTVGDGQNGNDCFGHGTHVAGIVGGTTYGVAKGVNLKAMRVLDCRGFGQISNILAAFDWISINKTGPSVVNISLEFAGDSPALDTGMANAKANGVFIVSAAGNSSGNACGFSPALSPSVMAVGATDPPSDIRWLGSNTGSCVDIWAPGLNILSAYIGSPDATATMGGTSMSAPHVAGIAALYLQNAPLDGADTVQNFIASNATANVIQNADPNSPNLLAYSGFTVIPYTIPNCSGTSFSGYINPSQVVYYPSTAGFNGGQGFYTETLTKGNGLGVLINLQKKQGQSWNMVSASSGNISYNGKSGTYRWLITGQSGNAGYVMCTSHP